MTLEQRCNVIEESYEYMLAYAGQGVPGDDSGSSQIHSSLTRALEAMDGLAEACASAIGSADPFVAIVKQDAAAASAAVNLVLKQRTISSQLVDNLNASIHLRALLTDLFLLDEVVKAASLQG
jgi:hypothetical protein